MAELLDQHQLDSLAQKARDDQDTALRDVLESADGTIDLEPGSVIHEISDPTASLTTDTGQQREVIMVRQVVIPSNIILGEE